MNCSIEAIAEAAGGKMFISMPGSTVTKVSIDSRETDLKGALYVAIKGARHDGHRFIEELATRGVKNFMVTDENSMANVGQPVNFILVDDAVIALQKLAKHHRGQFNIPIIAITGSNGKTIVKEWLSDMLHGKFNICRSPKSYNSQIGAALSLLKLEEGHELGIFEAGISRPGEMDVLGDMIRPTIGIFTNLGDAHSGYFKDDKHKWQEKWKLFTSARTLIFSNDQPFAKWLEKTPGHQTWLTWSSSETATLRLLETQRTKTGLLVTALYQGHTLKAALPFQDEASLQNAMLCWLTGLYLGVEEQLLSESLQELASVAMRLEMKQGIGGAVIIDDSYNADLSSLKVALQHLQQQPHRNKIVVLSDMHDNKGVPVYAEIAAMLKGAEIRELVAIGQELYENRHVFHVPEQHFYPDLNEFLQACSLKVFEGKAILVKGARKFGLEYLTRNLQSKSHETLLEINLQAIVENLSFFRSKLRPGVKTMAMVKAFSYGSGGYEIASIFQEQKVDYLAVAYADEGVELRQRGIRLPIMVMNARQGSFETMISSDLEPEIFSIAQLQQFAAITREYRLIKETFPIHLKFDTGMHRLGLLGEEIPGLLEVLSKNKQLRVASVMTHLSASDDPKHDGFTRQQLQVFENICAQLAPHISYKFLRHALNSAGVSRFENAQYDMVRIGIGLYGISPTEDQKHLQLSGTFSTVVAQVKEVGAGESIGYNRKGIGNKPRKIATLAVGYADGFSRKLGNGKWSVKWRNMHLPTVGDICMDMCMVDATGTDIQPGDRVTIFDTPTELKEMAAVSETIPYEVLTTISQRVKRIYHRE